MIRKLALAATIALAPVAGLAEGLTHYLAIHVNENDPQVMNIALNNAQNVRNYYASQGDDVVIEVVAYGPGLHMLRADTSPVAARIAAMSLEMDSLSFAACGNTHQKMSEAAGTEVPLLEEAGMVTSGVVRLIELQEAGYSYLKP